MSVFWRVWAACMAIMTFTTAGLSGYLALLISNEGDVIGGLLMGFLAALILALSVIAFRLALWGDE